jgi:hypothetical protein
MLELAFSVIIIKIMDVYFEPINNNYNKIFNNLSRQIYFTKN